MRKLCASVLFAGVLGVVGCGSDSSSSGAAGAGNESPAGSGGGTSSGIEGSAAGPSLPVGSGCPNALALSDPIGNTQVVGDGSAASCTEAALHESLATLAGSEAGGSLLFACGEEEHTIALTSSLEYSGPLLIDGEDKIVLSGGGSVRILNLDHYSEVTVQRITMRDGFTEESGAAIHHPWYGTLHVVDSRFENNHAAQETGEIGGGAIFAGGLSEAIISGSEFVGNSASNGGAVLNRGSTLTIVDTMFRDNEATSYNAGGGQYGNGGGLYIDGMAYEDVGPVGDFHLCGSVFFNNGAKQHGSAVFAYFYEGSTSYIDQCLFEQNSFAGSPAGSGGLYHGSVPLYLTNSTFADNSALQGHGAAIQMESSEGTRVEATNCTFFGNEAQGNAGGIFASNSPLSVVNCTFAHNKADYAPAIFKGESGSVTLRNSIFSMNETDNEYSALACHESFTDGGGNLQWPATKNNGNDDTPCAAGILFADPLLGELMDNGGSTPTLAPAAESPALDLASECPETDQTGAARDTERCDSGAVELGS